MANYIGNSPDTIIRSKQDATKIVATDGQTEFTAGLDFAPTDFVQVFLNGIRLIETDDYTVGNNTITLGSGAALNDELIVTTTTQTLDVDTYSKVETDALLATKASSADVTAAITSDNVTDDGNALLNALIFGG